MDLSRRSKLTVGVLIGVAVVSIGVLGVRAIPVFFVDGGDWHQKIHWMVYGYDRVWYQHRTYVDPSKEVSLTELERKYGQGQKFIPTGGKVIGLPVYETPLALAFERQTHDAAPLLFLRKRDGKFIIYALSGGP